MINNRYKILSLLGEGRNKTFLCEDTHLNNKKMALKVLNDNADSLEERKFKDEFLTLRKLSHKHIVKAFDYRTIISIEGESQEFDLKPNRKFYTMDYVSGVNIAEFYHIVDEALLFNLIAQVTGTLFYLHTFNYHFKDIKVENILVTGDKENPHIFLIDFGSAVSSLDPDSDLGFVTKHYIAPEYLVNSKTKIDKPFDLYALGVLIYYLIYKHFPFDADSEVELLRAIIDDEPKFYSSSYTKNLIETVEKLLSKDTNARYQSAYEVLTALGKEDYAEIQDWMPPKVFVKNNLMMSLVNDFLYTKKVDQAVIVRGPESSGKTSLLDEIYYNFKFVLTFNKADANSNIEFWYILLQRIFFNPYLNKYFNEELSEKVLNLLKSTTENTIDDVRPILIEISKQIKFIVEFDDFNEYSEKTVEFLRQVIPIFLIYEIKIIIAENSEIESKTSFIESPLERITQPFDEVQLDEYLRKIFSSEIDTIEIKNILYEKTDLLPGSINYLLRELFINQIIIVEDNKLVVTENNAALAKIDQDFASSTKHKLKEFSSEDLDVIQILSAISISIPFGVLANLTDLNIDQLERIIRVATDKNILKEYYDGDIEFYSSAVKRIVYDTINDKTKLHLRLAKKLSEVNDKEIPLLEIADQYEKGGDDLSCYKYLKFIFNKKENHQFRSFQKDLLVRILTLELDNNELREEQLTLARVYFELGEYQNALGIINLISIDRNYIELKLMRGKILIELGLLEEAQNLYSEIKTNLFDLEIKAEVDFQVANIRFLKKEYKEAEKICLSIIECKDYNENYHASANNLLGILYFQNNKLFEAEKCYKSALEYYKREKKNNEVIKLKTNIGSVYYEIGEINKALSYWETARKDNQLVGSLKFDAILLEDFGITYLRDLELEKAIETLTQALSIFLNIKGIDWIELAIINLSEALFQSGAYEKLLNLIFSNSSGNVEEIENYEYLYILGVTSLSIGDRELFEKIYLSINNIENLDDSAIFSIQFQYLSHLYKFEIGKQFNLEKYYALVELAKNLIDDNLKLRIYLLLFDVLIDACDYEKALVQINSSSFIEQTRNNPLAKAYKHYYTGLVCRETSKDNYLEHFEKSYSILVDHSITELTWKITFVLAESYLTRGNLNKAGEFIELTQQLIYHFADNIKSIDLRNKYLRKPDRKSVLEKLTIWKKYLV